MFSWLLRSDPCVISVRSVSRRFRERFVKRPAHEKAMNPKFMGLHGSSSHDLGHAQHRIGITREHITNYHNAERPWAAPAGRTPGVRARAKPWGAAARASAARRGVVGMWARARAPLLLEYR